MTYSTAKYQLTHLLQDAWSRLGALSSWKITGGSTTTIVNSAWAGVEDEIFEDDDATLIYGSVVVTQDAGGAGAAPEGEIARITDYDSSTYTVTMDAVTVAPASGDFVGIASPLFPYQDMKNMANLAMKKLGMVDVVDTSIVIVADTHSYTLPIYKKPKMVRVRQSSEDEWEVLNNWGVIPAATGTAWTLTVGDLDAGDVLEVTYEGYHPKLDTFDDDINQQIYPELAVCALVAEAYQWYNNKISGSNAYMLQRENKALQDLQLAKVEYPILRLPVQVKGLPHWSVS